MNLPVSVSVHISGLRNELPALCDLARQFDDGRVESRE
jgi:hypothetical protein